MRIIAGNYKSSTCEFSWLNMVDIGTAGVTFFLAFFFLALLTYLAKTVAGRKRTQPPVFSGWLPWIGCALEFGANPLGLIRRVQQLHGRVFTIFAAGQRMTFLTEPKDFEIFFNSPEASFQLAVQDPCKNTANISKDEFFKYHRVIHDLVKGRLAPSKLLNMAPRVCRHLHPVVTRYGNNSTDLKVDLNDFVRDVLYSTIVPTLFGDDSLPATALGFEEFKEKFVRFDGSFEHGAKLPDFLLPEWAKCKNYFLQRFEKLCTNKSNNKREDTILQAVLETIKEENCSPKYAVLFLWASLANAVPITFWTLTFILCNAKIYEQLMKQISDVFGGHMHCDDETFPSHLSIDDLKKAPLLECCILEAVRLRSPGIITRMVVKPIRVSSYTIPPGDLLMLSPYWSHQDEAVFPDAGSFQPYRWLDKASFPDTFIAFGGGRYQCPGRWFAMMEMQIFIAVLLYNFHFRLEDKKIPEPSPLHVVGVPQPATPYHVTVSRRRHRDSVYMTTV